MFLLQRSVLLSMNLNLWLARYFILQRSVLRKMYFDGCVHASFILRLISPQLAHWYLFYFLVTGAMSAFSVSYADFGPLSGTIRFTNVVTNIGGHYHTSTGIFACQYSGLYVFTLNIIKTSEYNNAHCYIRKNGSGKVIAWTDPDSNSDGGVYSATNSVVLHLVQGDTVDVGGCSRIDNIHNANETSSFSGFLIKTD